VEGKFSEVGLRLYGVLRSSPSDAEIARLGDAAFSCILLQ
jgi:hypothetical protein